MSDEPSLCQVQDKALRALATYGNGGTSTTGKHAWTPTKICDDDAVTNDADTNNGMAPLSDGTPPTTVLDRIGENMVDCSLFDDAPPQSITDGLTNAERHKRATFGSMANSMDNLVEAINKQSREPKITQYVVTGKDMKGLEGGGPLFSFTSSLMDSLDNRNLIMGLSLDYIVVWLQEKRALCQPAVVCGSCDVCLFRHDGLVDLD
ncbi:hypothetical protein CsSME_00030103 [Camellia sinensis var. sinensis]